MKKVLLTLLALMPLLAVAKPKAHVRWCTFNIRLIQADDTREGFGWDVRKTHVTQYILDNAMDIIGMQEVTHPQLEYLLENLEGYAYVGVGRSDGKTKGEYTPVFYKKDKYDLMDSGNFWLSETPDVPGSKGWDAQITRVASWCKLKDKATGKIFMAVNTHFDHVGHEARRQSALLIIDKIREIVGKRPAVVTGDFNVTDKSDAYTTMTTNKFVLRDAFKVSPSHGGVTYSFHNYNRIEESKRNKIDFIFVTPNMDVIRTGIPMPTNEYTISDHCPHWADLQF